MDQHSERGAAPESRPPSGMSTATWLLAALTTHLALLDAAVETFWWGSPQRWWLTPTLAACAAASALVWRPGGRALARLGPASAAATPLVTLLAGLAASAWMPGGHENGMRLLLQPPARVLLAGIALAVPVSSWIAVRRAALLPAAARVAARVIVPLLGLYAFAALAIGFVHDTPFAPLFGGGAAWQAAPRWLQGTAAATFIVLPAGFLAALIAALVRSGVAGMKRSSLWTPTGLILALAIALSGYWPHANGTANASRSPLAGPGSGAGIAANAPGPTEAPRAADALRLAGLDAPAPGRTDPAVAADQLRYLLDQFTALQARVPRETFDPQAIVASVGPDPAALFAWVRDHTSWAPYRGALRGPAGVLMDRIGSSVDRSALLADLLRRAGRQARLAHAQLAPDEARALLTRVRAMSPAAAPAPQGTAWERDQEDTLSAYARRFSKDPEAFVAAAATARQRARDDLASARRTAHDQAAALAAVINADAPGNATDDALAAAADHWWVQYRQDGSWVDVDPTPSDATPGAAVTTARVSTSDQPPPASRWMVTIGVVIEVWSKGRFSERRVLTHRMAASDAAWRDITLAHAPLKFPDPATLGRDAAQWRSAALGVREWIPILTVGTKRVSQSSFREDGTVNDRPGRRGGGLANPSSLFGALGGGEEDPAARGLLTAEWVDFEIQGPGAPARRIRRTSFDLVGPGARRAAAPASFDLAEAARADRALSLLAETAIQVQVCRPSRPFLADRMLRRFIENRGALLSLVPRQPGAKPARETRTLLSRLVPASNALLRWEVERFAASDVGRDVFIGTPGIVTLRSEIVALPGGPVRGRGRFDIVANAVSVLPGDARNPFRTRIEQGVADTVVEAGGMRAGNTSGVFRAAGAQGQQTRVIASDTRSRSLTNGMSDDVMARIDADVSSGHYVALPERPVEIGGARSFGWWRVEAASGTTVGVMDTGFHQGLSEYIADVEEAAAGAIIGYIVADWVWDHTAEDREAAASILGTLAVLAGAALLASAGVDVSVSIEFGK